MVSTFFLQKIECLKQIKVWKWKKDKKICQHNINRVFARHHFFLAPFCEAKWSIVKNFFKNLKKLSIWRTISLCKITDVKVVVKKADRQALKNVKNVVN